MNTKPRDKKGRFMKVSGKSVQSLNAVWDRNEDWKITYNRPAGELAMLNESFEKAIHRLNKAEMKLYEVKRKQILWVSIAFILGTIFFMIIAKR